MLSFGVWLTSKDGKFIIFQDEKKVINHVASNDIFNGNKLVAIWWPSILSSSSIFACLQSNTLISADPGQHNIFIDMAILQILVNAFYLFICRIPKQIDRWKTVWHARTNKKNKNKISNSLRNMQGQRICNKQTKNKLFCFFNKGK